VPSEGILEALDVVEHGDTGFVAGAVNQSDLPLFFSPAMTGAL